MNKNKVELLNILKNQLVPALGCTEPIAVAYSAASASEEVSGELEKIRIRVSANIYKNGLKVGIPGTGERGLLIAAALGYLGGDPEKDLEVIEDVTDSQVEEAREMIDNKIVEIDVAEDISRFYIETVIVTNKEKVRSITLDKHLNIIDMEQVDCNNDFSDFEIPTKKGGQELKKLQNYTLEDIMEFIREVNIDKLTFLEEGITLSRAIAEEGLKQRTFLAAGFNPGDCDKETNLINETQRLCAAASEARMTGSKKAVMSNSGSGNQGITAFLTVLGAADVLEADHEQLLRALALSNLMTIYIKSYLGVLSAMCGAGIAAGTGASAGVVYLLDGGTEEIYKAAINMLGVVTGMICDGAKEGCAYKVALSAGWAVRSALIAVKGTMIDSSNGILSEDFSQLLENLSYINDPGMTSTDKAILDVMTRS